MKVIPNNAMCNSAYVMVVINKALYTRLNPFQVTTNFDKNM